MGRRITPHDLADYARCPRAWWYERHHELAALDPPALEARRSTRRAALGRRARNDPELLLIEQLLARRTRFAGGAAAHAADARRVTGAGAGWGCLPATLALLIAACVLPIALPVLAQRGAHAPPGSARSLSAAAIARLRVYALRARLSDSTAATNERQQAPRWT